MGALVRETRRPARVDRDGTDAASAALELGVHTAVGAPITVRGPAVGADRRRIDSWSAAAPGDGGPAAVISLS